jgi:hypothetical protein
VFRQHLKKKKKRKDNPQCISMEAWAQVCSDNLLAGQLWLRQKMDSHGQVSDPGYLLCGWSLKWGRRDRKRARAKKESRKRGCHKEGR